MPVADNEEAVPWRVKLVSAVSVCIMYIVGMYMQALVELVLIVIHELNNPTLPLMPFGAYARASASWVLGFTFVIF